MKDLFRVFKESDKLGFRLTAICGLNWLICWLFRLQFLVFEMIVCVFFIKEISEILKINPKALGIMMIIIIFTKSFSKFHFDTGKFICSFLESFIMMVTIITVLSNSLQINEFPFWFIMFLISFSIYQFMKYFQVELFDRYLFKKVLNKEYFGIKKITDPLPSAINIYVDSEENDVNDRMSLVNQRSIKEAYQDIVELSFMNIEKFTGQVYFREVLSGYEAPLKKEFSDIDEKYHLVFKVYPFGKRMDLSFKLIQLDLSRRKAFTVKGVKERLVNE
ncbi:hypothetical protein QM404_04605 [Streptococcus infantis]|uniref:hypothetical protein n=1 Tax=Streptococcus infantis TaxID=68892 RepID=UPI0039C1CFD0